MPSLQEAFIRYAGYWHCNKEDCYSCCGIADDNEFFLLDGLSKAKSLALIYGSRRFIVQSRLVQCPIFSKLKTLLLNEYWCVAPDFHSLTRILKNSPLLEKFTLQLFSAGPRHKVEITGRYNPMERSATISEHLKLIEVKCEVLNEKVYKVLKFLGTFNIYFLFK